MQSFEKHIILNPKAVTKADVINQIADKTGVERVDVHQVVESFFDVIKDNMAQGENVYVRGFGSFVVKKRAQKVARKVIKKGQKGEPMVIPAHFVPTFKASKMFISQVKDAVKA